MWSALLRGSSLPAVEQTVQFTERRHAILAGNVANANTPGYQTRDLSVENFQAALKEAITAGQPSEKSSPGHPSSPTEGLSQSQAIQNVRESMKQILYHDGSDISIETQVTEIAKNQSMHSTAIAILRNQFQQLKMAISESVNV